MIWQSQEFDLTVEEAEEYAAQIGSLIAVSEVYGGLPSGGSAGEILIKNSDEDYDAIWGIIKNGANIWWTDHLITQGDTAIYTAKRYVIGRTDMQPEIHDFLVGRDIEAIEGTPNTLYEIIAINQLVYNLKRIGNIGENDYNRLLNKPQIDGIEINKNSTSISLGLATASELEEKYTKPIGGIPASDLASDVHLVPSGGTIGQVLRKISNNDWDINWDTVNDGEDGSGVWYTTDHISDGENPFVSRRSLIGREGATVQVHDLLFAPDVGDEGDPTTLYEITSVGIVCLLNRLCKMQGEPGEDGVGVPSGGTTGQVLKKKSGANYDTEWADDSSGISDYSDLTNKPQINSVTLSGNKNLSDLGIEPEAFVVTITNSGGSYLADKTYSEIVAAAAAGKRVVATIDDVFFAYYGLINGSDALFYNLKQLTGSFWSISPSNVLTHYTSTAGTYSKPSDGIPASDLANDVHLIPSGGTTGQVLKKASGTDYDTEWADESGGGGTSDYADLTNKPQINSVILSGNKSLSDLEIQPQDFIVTVTYDSGNDAYSANKTFAQIKAARQAGKNVIITYGNINEVYRLAVWIDDPVEFAVFAFNQGTSVNQIMIDETNLVSRSVGSAYSKPSGGIPKTDLSSAVQTSLGKADTALQPGDVAEPFFVTYSTSDMTTWTCDKTFAQITAAMAAGKQVVMLTTVAGNPLTQVCSFVIDQTTIEAWIRIGPNTRYEIQYSSDNTISVSVFTEDAAWIGAVASNQGIANAGKILVVGSGGDVTTKVQTEEVTVSTAGAVTQALDAGKLYHFTGALTSLTITLNAAGSGQLAQYHFDFDCGSTAPTVTIPNTVTMPSGNFEASKHYEVDILNNYGVVCEW